MSNERSDHEIPLDAESDEFVKQKWRSRGWSNDMSPAAIKHRLKIVDDLYDAWRFLKKGKLVEQNKPTLQADVATTDPN